jgi:hypothetical protein
MTASARRDKAMRRAAERRRIRRWGSLQCANLVAEWRAQQDEVHQRILYYRLPADCRNRIGAPPPMHGTN